MTKPDELPWTQGGLFFKPDAGHLFSDNGKPGVNLEWPEKFKSGDFKKFYAISESQAWALYEGAKMGIDRIEWAMQFAKDSMERHWLLQAIELLRKGIELKNQSPS